MKKILITFLLICLYSICLAGYEGDGLGNHKARRALDMDNYDIDNVENLEVEGDSDLNMVTSSQTIATLSISYQYGSSSVTIITTQGDAGIERIRSTSTYVGGGNFAQRDYGQLECRTPVGKWYYVRIEYCIDVTGGTNETIEMRLYKNDSWYLNYRRYETIGAVNQMSILSVSGTVYLTEGDYVDARIINHTGTNNVETHSGEVSAFASQ